MSINTIIDSAIANTANTIKAPMINANKPNPILACIEIKIVTINVTITINQPNAL